MKTRKHSSILTVLSCIAIFLVVMITGGVFLSFGDRKANAYNASNPVPYSNNIGEITLNKYEERTDGLVFDPYKLEKLFGKLVQGATGSSTTTANLSTAKSSVDNSQSVLTGAMVSGVMDTTIVNGVSTQPKSLNFETMKNRLSDAPITLSFGGLDWTVVYATTNTTAGGTTLAGDLIVTLWLNDNVSTASQWSAASSSTDTSGDYPTSMYSSSYIRVKTLNAGGDDGLNARTGVTSFTNGSAYYATNTTSRSGAVSLNDRKTNQFAKYTLSNDVLKTTENRTDDKGNPITVDINPSLTSFLTQPKNVEYQRAENFAWAYTGASYASVYLLPNEAWGSGANGPDTSIHGWYQGGDGSEYSDLRPMPDKNAYYEWKEDYLWLPSETETGYNYGATETSTSFWGIPLDDAILKSTVPSGTGVTDVSWSRSGCHVTAAQSVGFSSGAFSAWCFVSAVGGVRPALHLNLSAAARSAAMPDPQDTTVTYNGNNRDLKSEEWYDSDYFDDTSICSVRYTDEDGLTLSSMPKEAGEYYAEFTLKNSVPYKWAGTPTSRKKTVKFTIEPKKLAVNFEVDRVTKVPIVTVVDSPLGTDEVNATIRYYDSTGTTDLGTNILSLSGKTSYQAEVEFDNPNYAPDYETDNTTNNKRLDFTNPATPINVSWLSPTTGSAVFNGSARGFVLGFDPSLVTVSLSSAAIADGASFDTVDTFSATNAGTYTVELELVNKLDYVWGADMGDFKGTTGTAKIEFEITPMELELTVNTVTPSDWSVYLGGSGTFDFQLPKVPTSVGTLAVVVYAQLPGSSAQRVISAPITLNTSVQLSQLIGFNTSSIIALGTYDLGVKIASSSDPNAGNFTYKLDKPYTLTIKEPVDSGGIIWKLHADGVPAGSMMTTDKTPSDTFTKSITYDGRVYSFTATPSGYTVDTTYGTKGYKTVKASDPSTPLTEVKNAGSYITTVCLSDGLSKFEFSINWTIDKVVFDLSEVRWLQDGQISFNEKIMGGSGLQVGLDPATIPEGLIPNYSGVRTAKKVGDTGTAAVTFTVSDTVNYTVPASGTASSYIFNDPAAVLTDFEWSKIWVVNPSEIPVDWTIGTIELTGNKKINGEVLAGGVDEYVEYDYYETDSMGNKLNPSDPPLSEPQITEGEIRYYVAVAKIKTSYAGSYIFDPKATAADLESPVFEAGNVLTGVTLAASKTAYVYWGDHVNFQFTVTSGMIAKNAFDIAYYHGMVRLKDAPIDPGTYLAQISLKSEFEKSYYIDGTSSFNFTIGCATITEKWKDTVKPSVLNLTQNESLYISYEYCDESGNLVSINDLRTPGQYSVRAKISDSTKYIFDNNSDTTAWHQFVVISGDTITNPTDSQPPFKDPVNPNDPSGGGSSGDTQPTDNTVTFTLLASSGANGQQAPFSNNKGLTASDYKIEYYRADGTLTDCNDLQVAYVKVVLQGEAASRYRLENDRFAYMVLGGNGSGVGTTDPNGDGEGNNPSDATFASYLPVILSAISLVLIVVFTVMAFNNASAAKNANAKAKKLATMSYSVAPAGLLLIMGLTETNWWIIAGVLMALALVAGIVAFMFRAKKLRAFQLVEDEQTRLAEEKEMAQLDKEAKVREEQIRRDNELRMMFASMQQSYQQAQTQQQQLIDYDMLQNMITSSLSSIQSQAALPPAVETQKEMEEFHAQMAEQQAQMAKQQEMLEKILQNQQQAQQSYVPPMYVPPEYGRVYEIDDDISWLGESEDTVSLEESYGALTDTKKRYYYEIGSHIMNHPRTSQNDGKYAVLFKHRGRTIFKLVIIGDAPVLYYPTDNGGRNDIRIASSVSLDKAKAVIDRIIEKVDNEL